MSQIVFKHIDRTLQTYSPTNFHSNLTYSPNDTIRSNLSTKSSLGPIGRKVLTEVCVQPVEDKERYPIPIPFEKHSKKIKPMSKFRSMESQIKKTGFRTPEPEIEQPLLEFNVRIPRFKCNTPEPRFSPKFSNSTKKKNYRRRMSKNQQERQLDNSPIPPLQQPDKKQKSQKLKNCIQQSLRKYFNNQKNIEKQNLIDQIHLQEQKQKLQKQNKKVRQYNSTKAQQRAFKPIAAWGVDQRKINGQFDQKLKQQISEIKKLRSKNKEVQKPLIKFKRIKAKEQDNKKQKQERKHRQNKQIQTYMQAKQKQLRNEKNNEKHQQYIAEIKRQQQLKKLQLFTQKSQIKRECSPKQKAEIQGIKEGKTNVMDFIECQTSSLSQLSEHINDHKDTLESLENHRNNLLWPLNRFIEDCENSNDIFLGTSFEFTAKKEKIQQKLKDLRNRIAFINQSQFKTQNQDAAAFKIQRAWRQFAFKKQQSRLQKRKDKLIQETLQLNDRKQNVWNFLEFQNQIIDEQQRELEVLKMKNQNKLEKILKDGSSEQLTKKFVDQQYLQFQELLEDKIQLLNDFYNHQKKFDSSTFDMLQNDQWKSNFLLECQDISSLYSDNIDSQQAMQYDSQLYESMSSSASNRNTISQNQCSECEVQISSLEYDELIISFEIVQLPINNIEFYITEDKLNSSSVFNNFDAVSDEYDEDEQSFSSDISIDCPETFEEFLPNLENSPRHMELVFNSFETNRLQKNEEWKLLQNHIQQKQTLQQIDIHQLIQIEQEIFQTLIQQEIQIAVNNGGKAEIYKIKRQVPINSFEQSHTNAINVQTYAQELLIYLLSNYSQLIDQIQVPLQHNWPQIINLLKQNEIWPHYFPIFPEILPVNLFLELETIRDNNDLMGEVESINNKMIFDSINLLLNNYRPYGIEGEPPIWSLRVRSARSILDYDMVIGDLMETLLRHSYTQLGKIPTDLELTENRQINEERIHQIYEERLANVLANEIYTSDSAWTNYELEEAQILLEFSD